MKNWRNKNDLFINNIISLFTWFFLEDFTYLSFYFLNSLFVINIFVDNI